MALTLPTKSDLVPRKRLESGNIEPSVFLLKLRDYGVFPGWATGNALKPAAVVTTGQVRKSADIFTA